MKYFKTLFIIVIAFSVLYYVIDRVFPYSNFSIEQYGNYYWPNRWWLVGHMLGGMTAALIGPFQFIPAFRNRFLRLHRNLGKIYIIAVVVASLSAMYMSFTVAPQFNRAWSVALFFLALPWIVFTLMAYRMIRLKRITQHREWMIRSYVVTFAFVAFRFIEESSFASFIIENADERAPTCIWISWAIPLLFTEVILQWNKKK